MASVGTGAVKIIDNDGDVVTVTSNKLDVNATLVAGALIDIGDVEILGHSTISNAGNTDIGTSVESIGASAACKHIDIMASIANTGIIYVGASNLTAARGIALYPGDVYSIDIDNIDNIYVLATVDGEDVNYVYFN